MFLKLDFERKKILDFCFRYKKLLSIDIVRRLVYLLPQVTKAMNRFL